MPLFFFQQCSPVGIAIFTGEDPQSEWMKRDESETRAVVFVKRMARKTLTRVENTEHFSPTKFHRTSTKQQGLIQWRYVDWLWLDVYIRTDCQNLHSFYQCGYYLLLFTELCMNPSNRNQADTCIVLILFICHGSVRLIKVIRQLSAWLSGLRRQLQVLIPFWDIFSYWKFSLGSRSSVRRIPPYKCNRAWQSVHRDRDGGGLYECRSASIYALK